MWDREKINTAYGEVKIFSSASDGEPPAYKDDPIVSQVATIQYKVQPKEKPGVERSSLSRKFGSLKRKPLKVDIRLDIQENVLNVSITCADGSVVTTWVP